MVSSAIRAENLNIFKQSADPNATEEEIRHILKIRVAALRSRGLGLTLTPDWQETLITSVAQYFQLSAFELQRYRAEPLGKKERKRLALLADVTVNAASQFLE